MRKGRARNGSAFFFGAVLCLLLARGFDRDCEDAQHSYLQTITPLQLPLLEFLFKIVTPKAVFARMKEDVFRYEVLIEAGVELFEKIEASRFQDPGNLAESGLPIRDMVQNAEAEYGIKGIFSIGQLQNIGS